MKALYLVFLFIAILLGFVAGLLTKDFPLITFNPEVKLFEVLSFLLTLSIGLLIPFFVKRWIEDGRQVKNSLIDEVKKTLELIQFIKDKVHDCYSKKVISKDDKRLINNQFHKIDIQISSLAELLKEAFPKKCESKIQGLKDDSANYWKEVTGGDLMAESYEKIDESTYLRHNAGYMKLELTLKKITQFIHKL